MVRYENKNFHTRGAFVSQDVAKTNMDTAREASGRTTLEGGHLEETEERRGKVRSPFSHMPSQLGNIITEIDAHLSDPSCSLPYGLVAHAYTCACMFVRMGPATASAFNPTGAGNRFIGHPVHGI